MQVCPPVTKRRTTATLTRWFNLLVLLSFNGALEAPFLFLNVCHSTKRVRNVGFRFPAVCLKPSIAAKGAEAQHQGAERWRWIIRQAAALAVETHS